MAEATAPLMLGAGRGGRPLRVLITRPDEQAAETAELVRAAGGEPLLFPCLFRAPPADRQALLAALANPDGYDLVALTSANAALALGEALRELDGRAQLTMRSRRFAAVGPRTAAALAKQGLSAALVADGESGGAGLAAAITDDFQRRGEPLAGRSILFLRAADARPMLAAALRRADAAVTEAVAYQMVAADAASLAPLLPLLQAGAVDLLPFGSPRTAMIALSALPGAPPAALFARVVVGALGEATAAALREAGVRVDVVAPRATFAALLQAMRVFYDGL